MTAGAERTTFPILGCPFEAWSASPGLVGWLEQHWRREHPGVPARRYRITLRCATPDDVPAAVRGHLPANTAGADAIVRTAPDGERCRVWLGSASEGVQLDLGPTGADLVAWGGAVPTGEPGFGPLLIALHEAVRFSGLLPLHCAAAVPPGATGATVFLGPGGIGKSTTLLDAVRAGWTPVCEDFAWLDPEERQLYAWDGDVRLLPDALERLGPLVSHEPPYDAGAKRLVSYDELERRFGARRRTSAPLQQLVWLQRASGPSRWAPLPRVAAVPPLWDAIGLPLTPPGRRQLATQIAELVDTVDLGTLLLGTSPPPFAAPR